MKRKNSENEKKEKRRWLVVENPPDACEEEEQHHLGFQVSDLRIWAAVYCDISVLGTLTSGRGRGISGIPTTSGIRRPTGTLRGSSVRARGRGVQ